MSKNEDNHAIDVFSLFAPTDHKGRYTGSSSIIQCDRCSCKTKYFMDETPKLKDFICGRCSYTWGFYVEESVCMKESTEFLMDLLGEQQ